MSDYPKTQRKKFPECDHTGYGKYCHLYKQLKTGELVKEGNKYYPKKGEKMKLGIMMRTSMGWFFYPTSTNTLDNFFDIGMYDL